MPAPLIGITLDNRDNARDSGRYELGVGYAQAVAAAGGVPVMLAHEQSALPGYLERCDGFVVTGGVDPDTAALPEGWPGHGPMHREARPMDPQRQAFELALLDALERHPTTPVLGVCLGMQLMALRHGGTLNQYLPDTHPPAVVERHRKADHMVDVIAKHPWLTACGVVHSNHQQAIATPGRLRVAATAEDGIIEAIDDPQRPFYLGVQWHPERGDGSPLNQGLLHQLVRAASG